jgi:hypothetical protein
MMAPKDCVSFWKTNAREGVTGSKASTRMPRRSQVSPTYRCSAASARGAPRSRRPAAIGACKTYAGLWPKRARAQALRRSPATERFRTKTRQIGGVFQAHHENDKVAPPGERGTRVTTSEGDKTHRDDQRRLNLPTELRLRSTILLDTILAREASGSAVRDFMRTSSRCASHCRASWATNDFKVDRPRFGGRARQSRARNNAC